MYGGGRYTVFYEDRAVRFLMVTARSSGFFIIIYLINIKKKNSNNINEIVRVSESVLQTQRWCMGQKTLDVPDVTKYISGGPVMKSYGLLRVLVIVIPV